MADTNYEPAVMSKFLENPTPLKKQVWPDNTTPLVSISCITYNHENFIRDAITGFLNQKTTFPVEILIHDDASTDSTADIIREYELKYPQIIKPIYQSENRYSQGKRVGSYNRKRAVGEYIAMCEGDDYWTDPLKLEKQIKILQSNSELSMCMTAAKRIYEDKKLSPVVIRASDSDKLYFLKDILSGNPVHTATVVFKKKILENIPENLLFTFNFDYVMWVELARTGPIYYLNDVTAVYRVHSGGIYSSLNQSEQIKKSLKTRYTLLENTEPELKRYLYKNIYSLNNRLIDLYVKNNDIHGVSKTASENLSILKYLPEKKFTARLSTYLKSKYNFFIYRNFYLGFKYIFRQK
jgi:glycosyltransferase involved in cell wall biosynthesis